MTCFAADSTIIILLQLKYLLFIMILHHVKYTLFFNQQDETKGDYEKILVALCGGN